ncbi:MAG: DEAD/DEAH box helicase [Myxococcota bacterium]
MSNVFEELPEIIREGIHDLGWTQLMPVQEQVLPVMREGHDLIVQAQTGSGKTGAFGIPIVTSLEAEKKGCQALVMCPTRELANQVAGEIEALGRPKAIRCLPIYGGVGYQEQIDGIEAGHHVIVGTPGRILDHLGSGRLSFADVKMLVLDEADEMLSLGFWPDMREINKHLPKQRQSCLFSATIPEKVLSLSRFFLNDPKRISLSEEHMSPQQIEHYFVVVSAHEKEKALVRIIQHESPESAIIFCNTKDDVRSVTNFLQRNGLDADQISGDLSQAARERAMQRIKSGELRFLVATDVAARGIDISDLTHVISFAAPASPDVYVHRTGRTGRVGKSGTAISLVSGLDIGNFQFLQHANKIKIEERKLPSEAQTAEKLGAELHEKIGKSLATLRTSEARGKLDRFLPVVEAFAADAEGRLDLATLCAAFLEPPQKQKQGRAKEEDAASGDPIAERSPSRGGRTGKPSGRGGHNRGGGGRGRRPRGNSS